MMTNYFLGIDPGLSGAIAIYDGKELLVFDMPIINYKLKSGKTRKELNVGRLASLINQAPKGDRTVYLEQINGRPGQSGFTEFRFGECYGMTKATIAMTATPYVFVTPQEWKKHYGLKKTKGMTQAEYKKLSRDCAIKQFPDKAKRFAAGKDDGRAEAALIALYGFEKSRSLI